MNMSQNQEIIEAKLCAYIDGELDAEGRVEIERHLEANPQHRRLLESLRATRDLLKWLPREAAPAEVAETLNGQLERSVLLDDETSSLGPSIWPRVFAAAAIVLLTAGLFAAVYFTLPKSQKMAIPYAREGAGSPGLTSDSDAMSAAPRPEAAPLAKAEAAGKMSGPTDQLQGGAEASKPELQRLELAVNRNRAAIAAVANGQAEAPGAAGINSAPVLANNAMVVLVRSNSLSDTRKQLASYLDSQKIQWKETEPLASLASSAANQQALPPVQQQSTAAEWFNDRQAKSAATQEASTQIATVTPNNLMLRQQETESQSPTTRAGNFAMTPWNITTADGWYVARMSRQQAVQMSNTISQEGPQTVELRDLENSAATQSSAPTTNETRDLHGEMVLGRRALGSGAPNQPTTRPSVLSESLKDAAAATQPAKQALSETEQTLDVVILVQPTPVATQPATEPAIQPSSNPATPQTQPSRSENP